MSRNAKHRQKTFLKAWSKYRSERHKFYMMRRHVVVVLLIHIHHIPTSNAYVQWHLTHGEFFEKFAHINPSRGRCCSQATITEQGVYELLKRSGS